MSQDFIGYTYAALVASGGVMGFVKSASLPSLGAGLAFGAILGCGAYFNSQETPRPFLQIAGALALGLMMGNKFYKTGSLMPAGIITVMSVAVLVRSVVIYKNYLPMIGSKVGSD